MGRIHTPERVKLFMGVIAVSMELIKSIDSEITKCWGTIDAVSEAIPFTFTDYYDKEMGKGLLRQWLSFERPISPDMLAGIKVKTNSIEEMFSHDGKRRINLDPGYVTPAKVVLASSKDFSHRIYLSDGIYAEITLLYKGKSFISLPWTYPDYKSDTAQQFLNSVREKSKLKGV